MLAAVALLLTVMTWLDERRDEDADSSALAGLNLQMQSLQQNAAQKQVLEAETAETHQTLKALSDKLDSFDAELADLRKRSEEGRDSWIKDEAASLLVAAIEEIDIRANPLLAIKALQQADGRLKLLSDPRLLAVRSEIAREIDALRTLPQSDLDGMAVALAGYTAGVDQFPLRRSVPENYVPGETHDEVPAGKQTLWVKLEAGLTRLANDMFTVRRRSVPVEPLLAPKEEFFLRRNLELRLDAARAALLNRDGRAFQDSVHAARVWMMAYFDMRDNAVKAAAQQLTSMEQQNIAPPLPDISGSLALLRELETPRNAAP
jgi:uncharacterized protein HemX